MGSTGVSPVPSSVSLDGTLDATNDRNVITEEIHEHSILREPSPSETAGMVPDETSGQGDQCQRGLSAALVIVGLGIDATNEEKHIACHETPAASISTPFTPDPPFTTSEASSLRLASKHALYLRYRSLAFHPDGSRKLSDNQAARELGVSNASLTRMNQAVAATFRLRAPTDGPLTPDQIADQIAEALSDKYHRCGRKASLELTAEEEQRLQSLYMRSNRTAADGSMQTACKFFAHDPQTREEIRTVFLAALEKGFLPRPALKALKRITKAHFAAYRKPRYLAANHFAGKRGSFIDDKIARRRVVESDDATLNFACWIPWPQGGDPVSDKYGVRLGRWQFLPALEAGWSHYYLGYVLVARPRGSYTEEDVRSVISMVARNHGLPDQFRFERGTWESNGIVELISRLGVELKTVWQSNKKPYIENGFNALWTYLSLVDGQVGRFRGEMEKANLDVERCRAGRLDPREVFPSLQQCTKALDGALAMRNSDKIRSQNGAGEWIPEVRHRELNAERPWTQFPAKLEYLFSPIVREWTVQKGTVGGQVTLGEALAKVPFWFHQNDLWRWNGHKVRLYFNVGQASGLPVPGASGSESKLTSTPAPTIATIVSLERYLSFSPGDVICQATLMGEIPSFTRAASGWQDPPASSAKLPSQRGPLSELRREVRALTPQGRVSHAVSEERNGHGAAQVSRSISTPRSADCQSAVSQVVNLRSAGDRGSDRAQNNPEPIGETIDLTPTQRPAFEEEEDFLLVAEPTRPAEQEETFDL